jgi:hypothetical protein
MRHSEAFNELHKLSKSRWAVYPSNRYVAVAGYIGTLFMSDRYSIHFEVAIACVEELTDHEWWRVQDGMFTFDITTVTGQWEDKRVGLICDLETIRALG